MGLQKAYKIIFMHLYLHLFKRKKYITIVFINFSVLYAKKGKQILHF